MRRSIMKDFGSGASPLLSFLALSILLLPLGAAAQTVEVDRFVRSAAELELITRTGAETIHLAEPATVHVFFETTEGEARDDEGDGLDEVESELVSLELTGTSSLGPVQLRLSPTLRSPGQIEERENHTPTWLDVAPFAAAGVADSSFDVFFEPEVRGEVLHNEDPLPIHALISHKPPAQGEPHASQQGVKLLDPRDQPTDFAIDRLDVAFVPEPGARLLLGMALALSIAIERRRMNARKA